MQSLSGPALEVARSSHARFLRAASKVTEEDCGKCLGVSDSKIHRMKECSADFCALLARLDLKVVSADRVCYSTEYIDALKTLARAHIAPDTAPAQLEWD